MKKRFLALALGVVMVFALLPAMALAANNTERNTDVLEPGVNTKDAQVVLFGGYYWYVIGINGKGVANADNNYYVTLLAMEPSFGKTAFMTVGAPPLDYTNDNCYLKDEMKKLKDNMYYWDENAISPYMMMDLDGLAEKIWPLSVDEAEDVDKELLKFKFSGDNTPVDWWLRTMGTRTDKIAAALVTGEDGKIDTYGRQVNQQLYIRPTLLLHRGYLVKMVSAVNNGKKTDHVGENGLTAVTPYSGNIWKLTIQDLIHTFDIVASEEYLENIIVVDYEDAQTGDNEYISAYIENKDGELTYYGRIAPSRVEEGRVAINIEGKMNVGDKLYVFNEQYNGDYKTDYVSHIHLAYTMESHTHAWGENYENNDTHHWHPCTEYRCDITEDSEKQGYAPHDYTDENDTTCNTCGYERTITHTHRWTSEWTTTSENHWHECIGPGECYITVNGEKQGFGSHVYDNVADDTCNECGYKRTAHTHVFDSEWTTDLFYHWHKCIGAEGECDIVFTADNEGYGEHAYDDEYDATCNVCGYERTVEAPPEGGEGDDPATPPSGGEGDDPTTPPAEDDSHYFNPGSTTDRETTGGTTGGTGYEKPTAALPQTGDAEMGATLAIMLMTASAFMAISAKRKHSK